jgi:hypothetical protein
MTDGNENEGVAETEGEWCVQEGDVVPAPPVATWRQGEEAEIENLTYSNPFNQELERVWFDGKVVFAAELGELDLDPETAKVAQEYQIVYDVELDERGKLRGEPDRVGGQFNIYDSVPGMDKYSPLWLFNYVVVPRDYEPNTLRSERDCLDSGYEIRRSTVVEN